MVQQGQIPKFIDDQHVIGIFKNACVPDLFASGVMPKVILCSDRRAQITIGLFLQIYALVEAAP